MYLEPIMSNKYGYGLPGIIHANGPAKESRVWTEVVDRYFTEPEEKQKTTCPNELSILTWSDQPENETILQKNFQRMGLEDKLNVLPLDSQNKWMGKITQTLETLRNLPNQYVMGLDAFDVLILGRGTINETLDRFKAAPCKAMYGAEITSWPASNGKGLKNQEGELYEMLKYTENLEKASYGWLNDYSFIHLCSGTWIGEKDFLIQLYEYAANLIPEGNETEDEGFFGGDQGFLRVAAAAHFPEIILDYKCENFLNLSAATENHVLLKEDDGTII